jgi:hypothetical protein
METNFSKKRHNPVFSLKLFQKYSPNNFVKQNTITRASQTPETYDKVLFVNKLMLFQNQDHLEIERSLCAQNGKLNIQNIFIFQMKLKKTLRLKNKNMTKKQNWQIIGLARQVL